MSPKVFAARSLLLSANLALFSGCLPDGDQNPGSPELVPESSTGTVTLVTQGAGIVARTLAPEPGGKLLAQIRTSLSQTTYKDSVGWSGSGSTSLQVSAIPEGRGYQAILLYRDPNGIVTHSDTLVDLEVKRSSNTQADFALRALLGRVQLIVPSAPATIDSLGLSWESNGWIRSTHAVRGPSGRTLLRLDSLAVGATGTVRVRAWTTAGDTLYFADTTCSILSQTDQSLQVKLLDAQGQLGISATFLPGGEVDAVALFPDASVPSGSLIVAALSDSGSSDWILLRNPTGDSVTGLTRITRGSESFSVDLHLAAGEQSVLTRASCAAISASSHPLHGAPGLVCGLESVSVSWSSTGTLWEIRTSDGGLADQVVVVDGRYGWPDLNTTNARTVRRRSGIEAADASAGRSWCADDMDSPIASCI